MQKHRPQKNHYSDNSSLKYLKHVAIKRTPDMTVTKKTRNSNQWSRHITQKNVDKNVDNYGANAFVVSNGEKNVAVH